MVFKSVWILEVGAGEDFRSPIDFGVTVLAVLRKSRVAPFAVVCGAFMFRSASVDAAARFSDVGGAGSTLALEFVNPFAFVWVRSGFITTAEDAL